MKYKSKLSPGDMVYYSDNLATALLIEYCEDRETWKYSLRSPTEDNRCGRHFVKLAHSLEQFMLEAIKSGKFEYYPVNKELK